MPQVNFTPKRAQRCPAAGMGWLFLEWEDRMELCEGAPSPDHPDPRLSGQNPAFTDYIRKGLRFIARRPRYRPQFENRLQELTKARDSLIATRDGINAELSALQTDIDDVASFIAENP